MNRSGEGVMLKMALVVVNALKAPESESLWNQEAGCKTAASTCRLAWLSRTGTLSKFFHQIVVGNLGEQ